MYSPFWDPISVGLESDTAMLVRQPHRLTSINHQSTGTSHRCAREANGRHIQTEWRVSSPSVVDYRRSKLLTIETDLPNTCALRSQIQCLCSYATAPVQYIFRFSPAGRSFRSSSHANPDLLKLHMHTDLLNVKCMFSAWGIQMVANSSAASFKLNIRRAVDYPRITPPSPRTRTLLYVCFLLYDEVHVTMSSNTSWHRSIYR